MLLWPKYPVGQAENDFNKLTVDNMTDISLSFEFQELREKLLDARDEIFERHNFDEGMTNDKYSFDLEFGLALYNMLQSEIDNRDIYTDEIWMYLSIKIIPDVVHARWSLDPSRYFQMSRRIYLKQIWWYIHLSWITNKELTYERLKMNSTDTIQALVERPGLGYNIEMYREIIKQYAEVKAMPRNEKRSLLRKVMVLNTARAKTVAPELVDGGIEGYVSKLYRDVM